MNKLLRVFLAAVFLPVTATANADGESVEAWYFDVFLGDKVIGYHRFEASAIEDGWLVQSNAEFEVKFLFISAFDYAHSNSEIWNDGCLRSIDATTNTNGKRFEVLGRQARDGFIVETNQESMKFGECVASFAYWNRQLLTRERLLNAQTGEYLQVDSKQLPVTSLQIGDRQFSVERIHLSARGMDIVVSYDTASGQWLGLDSTLKNGRQLVYRRSPDNLESPQRVAREASLFDLAGS